MMTVLRSIVWTVRNLWAPPGCLTTLIVHSKVNCVWHIIPKLERERHPPAQDSAAIVCKCARASENARWLRVRVRLELWTHWCVCQVGFCIIARNWPVQQKPTYPINITTLRCIDNKLGTQHTFDYIRLSTNNIVKKNAKNSGTNAAITKVGTESSNELT